MEKIFSSPNTECPYNMNNIYYEKKYVLKELHVKIYERALGKTTSVLEW